MRRLPLVALLALAACSDRPQPMMAAEQSLAVFDTPDGEAAPDPAAPRIAYSYAIGYRLPSDALAAVQAGHVAACRQLGPGRCLLVKTSLNRSTGGLDDASAETRLLVDARLAAGFGARLDRATTDAGGSVTTRTVTAEDVTKQVIDTDARVRAKQALAARLLQLLAKPDARVADLVAAEKAHADAQEELDAARGLQAVLSRRVRMSSVDLSYVSTASTGSLAPVRRSVVEAGETLAGSLAALVTFVVAAIPWALLLAGLVWLLRKLKWRPRWWLRRRGTLAGSSAD